MLERERTRQNTTSETRSNMMSMLVSLVDAAATGVDSNKNEVVDDDKGGKKRASLMSEEEILGNLFIFTGAGFDTTANTMTYGLALLTTYPEWQDWLYEELSTVLLDKDPDKLEYNEIYPKLPRCLSVMVSSNQSPRRAIRVKGIESQPLTRVVRNTSTVPTADPSRQRNQNPGRDGNDTRKRQDVLLPTRDSHLRQHGRAISGRTNMGSGRTHLPALSMVGRPIPTTGLRDSDDSEPENARSRRLLALVGWSADVSWHEDEPGRVCRRLHVHLWVLPL